MSLNKDKKVGKLLRIPYDLRKPTKKRLLKRLWNPGDNRLITPKAFGWGYDINFYRLFHRANKVDKK